MHVMRGLLALLFLTPATALALEREAVIAGESMRALRGAPLEAITDVRLRWIERDAVRGSTQSLDLPTRMRRIEIYAAGAKVLEATGDGLRELPRDQRLHFISVNSVDNRLALSMTPDGVQSEGVLYRQGRAYALVGTAIDGEFALRDLGAPLADGSVAVASCSGDLGLESAKRRTAAEKFTLATPRSTMGQATPKVATRQVTVAVDTDNELLLRKFSNNTTNATSYIAALFTAMNLFYEDNLAGNGLQLRLLLGTTILRPSSTPDPFNTPDTNATPAALNEFGAWWSANQGGVPRAFALLLSGKSSNQNSASGIAWLLPSGSYCTATGSVGGHYSVNNVLWNPALAAAQDAFLVGHELGHNLGARHTHCANAIDGSPAATGTIDRCYNGEAGLGCYAGTQACPTPSESPTSPQGSLMSYCDLNGLGCGASTEMHPTHVAQLNGRLNSQLPSCVAPIGSVNQAPTINAPASYNGTEDTTLTLNGLSFADADAASGSLTATFSVPSGSVNATAFAGVTIGGSATARTLAGTLSALNGLLAANNLSHVPAANANGTVNLSINLNDNGNTGSGGAQQANRVVPMNFAAVNDAPTQTLPASVSVAEDQASAVAGIIFSDVDAGSASLTATFALPDGTLNASTGGGVTAGGTATSRTLTGTIANLNAFIAAGSLTFTTTLNATANVTLSVTINDGGATGSGGAQQAQGNVTLVVMPMNDPPSLNAPANLAAIAGQFVSVGGVSYADVDSPSGSIAVLATYSTPSGTFTASSGGGVTVAGSATATLTLSGTLAAINTFVGSTPVRFVAADPSPTSVTLALSISDLGNVGAGGPLVANRNVIVSVLASNDGIFLNGFEP